ncbi:hypothetical protein O0880_05145 [Janthinobacterium sp. SUN118]|uniref:RHS repeat domain-containing protein n=1 Tax=Janthinobacterium sp. SUN118 TaxID=3004100 RepID=UPI0025B0524F|nr:hypothetical protein [Janthinobacterium sp. SUN118]MDN2708806.1 hypothetical protein [Janthinobacterium sp. SUN118]
MSKKIKLLILFLVCPNFLFAQNLKIEKDPYGEQADLRMHENYGSFDSVDPYSGNLRISQKELVLRNSGGFDLGVFRNYDVSRIFFSGNDENYQKSATFVGFGWGWSVNVAPKLLMNLRPIEWGPLDPIEKFDQVCTKKTDTLGVDYLLEHVDGKLESLHHFDSTYAIVSASNWKLTCDQSGIHVLHSPDGTSYRMDVKTHLITSAVHMANQNYNDDNRPALSLLVQASKITDKFGNWFAIEYLDAKDPKVFGTSYVLTASKLPAVITSSDSQVLRLNYESGVAGTSIYAPGRTARLSTIVRSDGAVWTYKYKNTATQSTPTGVVNPPSQIYSLLTEVIRPDGDKWLFDYWDNVQFIAANEVGQPLGIPTKRATSDKLKRVTLPTGGTVSYEYEASKAFPRWISTYEATGENVLEANEGTILQNVRVKKRSTSDNAIWNYTYKPGTVRGEYDMTTVDGPEGRTQYKHIGVNFFTPPIVASSGDIVWGYGTYENNVAWKVGLLLEKKVGDNYIETYSWDYRDFALGGNTVVGRIGLMDFPAKTPKLLEKTILMDGASYQRKNSNFDSMGNIGRIVESGPNGGAKDTTITYVNDTNRWILGVLKSSTSEVETVSKELDANYSVLSQTINGVTEKYTYDSMGNVSTKTAPRGLLYTYSNYKRGVAQKENQPEDIILTRIVDDSGNVISDTNGEGRTTTYTYDGLDRMTSTTYPVRNKVMMVYGANSRTVLRGPLTEEARYDAFGRVSSISLGGVVKTFEYDGLGRMIFDSHPGASSGNSYQYDQLGRIVRLGNSDGTFESYSYAAGTNHVVDERGYKSSYKYRSYADHKEGLLMEVTAPEVSANIIIERNPNGLISSVSQDGQKRSYTYDANNYLVSVINPETGTTIYGRDAAGNMTSKTVGSSGRTIYTYDGQNRLISSVYPGDTPSVTNSYNKNGKILTSTSAGGNRIYEYDGNGNLIVDSLTVDGNTFSALYSYTNNDQLRSTTYPRSGRVVSYSPDVLGRPTKVSGYVNSISYWPSGQLREVSYKNGTVTKYDQNVRLWPSNFTTEKNGGSIYLNSNYGFDGSGNLTSINDVSDASYNRTLRYDGINRLVGIDGPWGAGTISYSGGGNITRQILGNWNVSYQYQNNRLSSVSGSRNGSYAYDAYGNITAAPGVNYSFDNHSNLRCVNCHDVANKLEYGYDASGQRSIVAKGGIKNYEMYGADGKLLIEFRPAMSDKLVEYFYLGNKRIAQRISPSFSANQNPGRPDNPAGPSDPNDVNDPANGVGESTPPGIDPDTGLPFNKPIDPSMISIIMQILMDD